MGSTFRAAARDRTGRALDRGDLPSRIADRDDRERGAIAVRDLAGSRTRRPVAGQTGRTGGVLASPRMSSETFACRTARIAAVAATAAALGASTARAGTVVVTADKLVD